MMDEEDLKELIVSRVQGRGKYYFPGAKGEALLQKLEAQKRKVKKAELQKRKTVVKKVSKRQMMLVKLLKRII